MPFGGQMPPVKATTAVLDRFVGEQRGVEERPEPGDEEHHLGGDEQDHAVAVADLHDARVIAVLRLVDDVEPPGGHHIEHAGDADAEQRAGLEAGRTPCPSCIDMMSPTAIRKAKIEPISGHGLGLTR